MSAYKDQKRNNKEMVDRKTNKYEIVSQLKISNNKLLLEIQIIKITI